MIFHPSIYTKAHLTLPCLHHLILTLNVNQQSILAVRPPSPPPITIHQSSHILPQVSWCDGPPSQLLIIFTSKTVSISKSGSHRTNSESWTWEYSQHSACQGSSLGNIIIAASNHWIYYQKFSLIGQSLSPSQVCTGLTLSLGYRNILKTVHAKVCHQAISLLQPLIIESIIRIPNLLWRETMMQTMTWTMIQKPLTQILQTSHWKRGASTSLS